MAERPDDRQPEIKVDPASLYLEEVFTDRRIGTIRRLTPVKATAREIRSARSPTSARRRS